MYRHRCRLFSWQKLLSTLFLNYCTLKTTPMFCPNNTDVLTKQRRCFCPPAPMLFCESGQIVLKQVSKKVLGEGQETWPLPGLENGSSEEFLVLRLLIAELGGEEYRAVLAFPALLDFTSQPVLKGMVDG